MSRFGRVRRVRRRPDHWASTHERARLRIAERMAGELRRDEATWLEEHLAGCAACTALAAQYAADREALRALRDATPVPPRDLWARTASAIEQGSGQRHPRTASQRSVRLPIGALSGIAVIAVVIGVSTLSSGIITPSRDQSDKPSDQTSTTGGDAGSGPAVAQATPFAVGAGSVQWVDKSPNGSLAYNTTTVDEVCPAGDTSGCPTLQDRSQQDLALDSKPTTIIESPSGGRDVVISTAGDDGDQIVVLDLPEGTPSPTTTPTDAPITPTPSTEPTSTTGTPSDAPPSSPSSSAETASASPSATPVESRSPTPSVSPVLPSPPPSPALSPTPSSAVSIAIANDIELVGESAAFSADGSWFAFTARPEDGSSGPDVYVWQVGDESARPITTDGSTVFASWDGNQIVASRPAVVTSAENETEPVTVRIDPTTGVESSAGDVWRPVVDPTRSRAVGWTGSLARSADGETWVPGSGKLELRDWTPDGARPGNGGQGDALVAADAASAGFDVRWDEAGDWVAIWVADAVDPSVGRLSLYHVDPARGELERPKDAPADVAALPGFSIGEGRLAWATPPGQDGEGSRVQIVAWNEDGVGSIETAPGEDVVIIR
jgi:hypothetical protein